MTFYTAVFNVEFPDGSFQDIETKSDEYEYCDYYYRIFTFYDDNVYLCENIQVTVPFWNRLMARQLEPLPSIYNSEKQCFELYYLMNNTPQCVQLCKINNDYENGLFKKFIRENGLFEINDGPYLLK